MLQIAKVKSEKQGPLTSCLGSTSPHESAVTFITVRETKRAARKPSWFPRYPSGSVQSPYRRGIQLPAQIVARLRGGATQAFEGRSIGGTSSRTATPLSSGDGGG